MRVKYRKGGAEPPINHPRYEKALPSYTADLRRICQYLANSDPDIRHHALTFLPRAIEESLSISSGKRVTAEYDTEQVAVIIPMLWKAFFFVLWHEDGIENQDQTTHTICDIPSGVTVMQTFPAIRSVWVRESFQRLKRDWASVDKWRLDKFLYLARRILYSAMRMIPAEELVHLLRELFQQADVYPLASHMVDVFLDECARSPAVPASSVLTFLQDIFGWALACHPERALHRRIQQWVIEPLCAGKLTTDPAPLELSTKTNNRGKLKKGVEEKQAQAVERSIIRLIPYQFCAYLDQQVTAPATRDGNRALLMSVARTMRDYLPIHVPSNLPTQDPPSAENVSCKNDRTSLKKRKRESPSPDRNAKRATGDGGNAASLEVVVQAVLKTKSDLAPYTAPAHTLDVSHPPLVVAAMPRKPSGARAPVDVERAPHERAKSKQKRKDSLREKRLASQRK